MKRKHESATKKARMRLERFHERSTENESKQTTTRPHERQHRQQGSQNTDVSNYLKELHFLPNNQEKIAYLSRFDDICCFQLASEKCFLDLKAIKLQRDCMYKTFFIKLRAPRSNQSLHPPCLTPWPSPRSHQTIRFLLLQRQLLHLPPRLLLQQNLQ
jgi:hypothetical protein